MIIIQSQSSIQDHLAPENLCFRMFAPDSGKRMEGINTLTTYFLDLYSALPTVFHWTWKNWKEFLLSLKMEKLMNKTNF